jgi:hypothetical protein
MVLGMKVSIPQQDTNEQVGTDAASVAETIGFFRDFAVSVLQVTNIVHDWVAKKDWDDPPEQEGVQAFLGLPKEAKDESPVKDLDNSGPLKSVHDTALVVVGPIG